MSNLNEVIDSLNNENAEELKETLKTEALAQEKRERQLYSRAKKAEGFELKDGKWVKKEVKIDSKPTATDKPGEIGYGEKSFINQVLGVRITDTEQMKLVEDYLANGKSLESLVDNKHFKNDLKDIQDNQSAKAAIPTGTRGTSGSTAKDSVDYWINKKELPENVELRRQVVNERIKREKSVSHFAK